MMDMPKFLMIAGIILIVIGLVWQFIGRLPGDIVIKKGNSTFYFPIVTSIIVSIVLSLIISIIGRLK